MVIEMDCRLLDEVIILSPVSNITVTLGYNPSKIRMRNEIYPGFADQPSRSGAQNRILKNEKAKSFQLEIFDSTALHVPHSMRVY